MAVGSARVDAGPKAPYDLLKLAILEGALRPGDPVVESKLASRYGVSRTPIREALTRLEQDGLMQRTERGWAVRQSSPEEILDIYDTRIVLEGAAAAFAAERRTNHDLMAMRHAAARNDHLSSDTPPGVLADANREFHRTVWRASHNASLTDLLERINLHLGRYPETTLTYPGRQAASLEQHTALIEAIEARDSARAQQIASEHFAAARDIRLRLWESAD